MLTFKDFLDLWSKANEETKQKVEELLGANEQDEVNNSEKV